MSGFTLRLDIAAPTPQVFSFLAESENTPLWYEAVEEARKLTPGRVQAGSRYRMVRRLPQGRVVNEVETSELEPDRRVTLRSLSGPTPFTYLYTLTPTPSGTLLQLDGEISAAGLPGPGGILGALAPHLFKLGMHRNLLRLKELLERR